MKRLRAIFIPIFLLGFITPAWTATVCPSGSPVCDYSSIQQAIDAAGDGGEILVSGGTYRENLIISGKAVTIRSVSGAENTIIDGGGAGPVVTFESSENKNIVFEGFTIQNGVSLNGGGIICEFASPAIQKCVIQNNIATENGGGVYLDNSQATLDECRILSNSAGSGGGGIYNNYGIIELNRCRVNGNKSAGSGGGIAIINSPSKLTNCLISRNSASQGGAIYTETSPVITNCTVVENIASSAGGIYCQDTSPVVINSIFWANGRQFSGTPEISYSIVQEDYSGSGNLNADPLFVDIAGGDYRLQVDSPAIDAADSSFGGAPLIDMDNIARPQIFAIDMGVYEFISDSCRPWAAFSACCSTFCIENASDNIIRIDKDEEIIFDASGSLQSDGGEFSWDFGDGGTGTDRSYTYAYTYTEEGVYTVNLQVSKNCAGNLQTNTLVRQNYIFVKPAGSVLYVPTDIATISEAIDMACNDDIIIIAPGVYTENIDFKGKDIIVKSSGGPLVTIIDGNNSGSVVTLNSGETSNAVLEGFTIRNGRAANGGGIYIADSSPVIRHCIIILNHAGSGGGIYFKNAGAMIERTKIIQNDASLGGGVYLDSAPVELKSCLIVGNRANLGGGIYDNKASPAVKSCTIYGNIGFSGANGMYTFFSNAKITNSILWDPSHDPKPEIIDKFSMPTFTYCDIFGGYIGEGNINIDPRLTNPSEEDPLSGDYRPGPDSTLIDTGDPGYQNIGELDLVGNPRIYNNRIDIGSYEHFIANTDPSVAVNAPQSGDVFLEDSLIVTVLWTAYDAEQRGADALTADVYYRSGPGGGTCADNGVSLTNIKCTHAVQASYLWDISGLGDGNDYNVCIQVTDGFGGLGEGGSGNFTIDRNPPSFMGIGSAEDAFTDGTVILSWSNANDVSPVSYLVYSALGSEVTDFSDTAIPPTTATTIPINGLENNKTYYFVVRAVDSRGHKETNTKQLSVIPTKDKFPPAYDPQGLTASNANTDREVNLSWNSAYDPNDPITYKIYHSTTSNVQDWNTHLSTGQTTYTVSDLINSQEYYFVVRASDVLGNTDDNTFQREATPTRNQDPPYFGGLVYANDIKTTGTVALGWNKAVDGDLPITYKIYYSTLSNGQVWNTTLSTGQTNYTVSDLVNSQEYYFVVRASDSFGNEDTNTIEKSATPTQNKEPPDFAGLYFAADAKIGGVVNLGWLLATDPNKPVTYNIYYTLLGEPLFSNIYTVTSNTSYRVKGLDNNRAYHFAVRANDVFGNEDGNTVAKSATPTAAPEDAAVFWNFDEGSGNLVLDGSGNNHDGTITNGVYADGFTNTALEFDENSYVRVPDADDLRIKSSLILDARILFHTHPKALRAIISKYDIGANKRSYFLALTQDRKVRGVVSNNGINYFLLDSTTTLSMGTWYRVTMQANSTKKTISLYIDESEKTSKYFAGFNTIHQGDADVMIGSLLHIDNPTFLFSGIIDEGGVYDTPLTPWAARTPPGFGGLESARDAKTGETVKLLWDNAVDSDPPISYNIYYDAVSNTQNPDFFSVPKNTIETSTSSLISGLTNGTPYYFAVRASDVLGNEDNNTREYLAVPTAMFIPQGVVSYWTFDEGSGDVVYDVSSRDNNGTIYGASWTTGKSGSALSFDEQGDYVTYFTAGIPQAPPVTLEAWIYFAQDQGPGDYDYIIQIGEFNGDIFNIAREPVAHRVYYVQGEIARFGPVLPTGEWIHLVMIFNNTAPYVEFYLNGEPDTIEQPFAPVTPGGPSCQMGRFSFSSGESHHYLNGLIDEVVIYNRALPATEIKNRYDAFQ